MKRTLSLILSLLMVFGVFAGFSVSAAEADTAETGEEMIATDAYYFPHFYRVGDALSNQNVTNCSTINAGVTNAREDRGTQWRNDTDNCYMNVGDIFEAGKKYTVRVYVQTKINYKFDTSKIFINLQPAKVVSLTDKTDSNGKPYQAAAIEYTFTQPRFFHQIKFVKSLAISNRTVYTVFIPEGEDLRLPDNVFFEPPEDKVFMQWDAYKVLDSYNQELCGSYSPNDLYNDWNAVTMVPVWEDIFRTITFDPNGGTGSMENATKKYGENFTFPTCPFTAPDGKVFDMWLAHNVGGGTFQYDPGETIGVYNDIEVKALWKSPETFTVSFDPNGGSGSMASAHVVKGEKYELPECAFAPPAGKEFRCWQVGTYMNPGSNFIVSMDTTVKAIWRNADENKCTISFDSNGGTGTMYNVTVNKGSFYNAPECTFTAPEGKQFSHWTVNGERFDGGTVRENTVLTANWVGAQIDYMECSIAEPVAGARPSYIISVPGGAAYKQEWNYTGGLWGDGVAWEEVNGDAIDYLSDYTFKPGKTYRVTISLVPAGGALFAESSALRGYINGEEAECYRYNANNVTLVRTFTIPGSGALIGDVNFDSTVDVLDAALVQKYAAGKQALTDDQLYVADVNDDHNVDVLDATMIQKYAAGKESEFKKKS